MRIYGKTGRSPGHPSRRVEDRYAKRRWYSEGLTPGRRHYPLSPVLTHFPRPFALPHTPPIMLTAHRKQRS